MLVGMAGNILSGVSLLSSKFSVPKYIVLFFIYYVHILIEIYHIIYHYTKENESLNIAFALPDFYSW
jgi:hypothetical protein